MAKNMQRFCQQHRGCQGDALGLLLCSWGDGMLAVADGVMHLLRSMCAVANGVTFRTAMEQNRPPEMSDVFEDPARWGQLATTAFKVGGCRSRMMEGSVE